MSMFNKKFLLIASCAFAATMAVGQVPQASAAYRRVQSSVCTTSYDNNDTNVVNGSSFTGYWSNTYVYCSAPSDSELPHGSTTTLNVHGYEASNASNYSRACAKNYAGNGTSCGNVRYWGSSWSGGIGVDTSSWNNNSSWMPYVYNRLGSGSSIYGFYMAD